ncbi:MAG: SMP-30/gluconolactonase/LRE family protein [Akkermansiaceae bacterium]|nr:SMP-30/gluconolactonase/LRE family protein [Akkermansiaceae bacterium]
MTEIEAHPAWQHNAEVGEGSLWDEREKLLYWVDIHGNAVHCFNPATGENRSWDVGEHVGTVVLDEQGGILLATQNGFARMDPENGQLTHLGNPEAGHPEVRFNDGKCDPAGRFWAGTMAYDCREGAGSLYCMEPDGSIHRKLDDLTISNGLVWSRDATKFYFIDSLTYRLDCYRYDRESGEVSNRQTVTTFDQDAEGLPDGMAIDADDGLWVAMFGGASVLRIDPATGARTHKITLPTSNITSCAFGGDDLQDIYITSATVHLGEDDLRDQPLAGSLFRARSPIAGVPAHRFAGTN